MAKTAETVWNNCLSFIEDNITSQAYKTWFEPIKAVKLTDNALSIQVPSKFFYEWLEEHYVNLLKVALTKELGPTAKLVYIIKMENTYGNRQPYTEKIPSANRSQVKSQEVDVPVKHKSPELKNPFAKVVKISSVLLPLQTWMPSRGRPFSGSTSGPPTSLPQFTRSSRRRRIATSSSRSARTRGSSKIRDCRVTRSFLMPVQTTLNSRGKVSGIEHILFPAAFLPNRHKIANYRTHSH